MWLAPSSVCDAAIVPRIEVRLNTKVGTSLKAPPGQGLLLRQGVVNVPDARRYYDAYPEEAAKNLLLSPA